MTERAELTVAFSSATYTVGEGEAITSHGDGHPDADRDVTVTVEITDGTGATLSGLDTDNMLIIEKGQSSASFTISAEDDDDADNDEVTLELRTDEYDYYQVLGNPSTAIVTIIDDDGSNNPPVITTTSPITVKENQTAVATLKATDPDDDPITRMVHIRRSGPHTVQPDIWAACSHLLPRRIMRTRRMMAMTTATRSKSRPVTEQTNSAELTLTVNVTDVNEPPPQMELPAFSADGTEDTTSMLLLRWLAPTLPDGTPSITGYDVQYRMQGEADWVAHNFASDGSTTETTITGLASNTHYDAQVRAVNVEGRGGWSLTSIAKTAEARLTVAFSSATYTVDEGDTADITVTVTPTADRNVTVTINMTGTGATLSGLDTDNTLTIARGQNSNNFTINGDQDDDATDGEVTLTLDTNQDDYVFLGQSLHRHRHHHRRRRTQQPAGYHNHLADHCEGEPDYRRHLGSYGLRRRSHHRMVHIRAARTARCST